MTRSQRIFLAIALPVIACSLHVTMCDWHYKEANAYGVGNATSYAHAGRSPIWQRMEFDAVIGANVVTGLTTGRRIDLGDALIWGIFVPLGLVAGDIWWLLGWRRHNRLATGRCANCGYDLQGTQTDRCPECGSSKKAARR